VFSRHPLPPGDLDVLDILEQRDRDFLRKRAKYLGPVFKGVAWDKLNVCVVGLDLCRKITRDHGHEMSVDTMELDHLIPKGFLSAMEGDDHQHYRAIIQAALKKLQIASDDSILDSIATEGLRDFASRTSEHNDSPEAFTSAMSAIATSMVTWLFFGAEPETEVHERFLQHFRELGPYGLVWNPKKRQENAFSAFRDDLLAEVELVHAGTSTLSSDGMLGQMINKGALDETLIGNLIYQAEMGRSDITNFFRWLTRHVADDPDVLARIAYEEAGNSEKAGRTDKTSESGGDRSLAESFVLETLRTDQSERLMRRAKRDFVFEGFLIPQFATIRLCLWESHHSEDNFVDPHQFDPARFLADAPGRDRFAPFGVDSHQCPFGSPVIRIGSVFVRALAHGFRLSPLSEGPPVRGAYHWEPAPKFTVHLSRL